ncbi:hypothetical protein D3C84_730800 [compost metagenome]
MAKQLRLQQIGRNRGAVELDKRPLAACAVKMQGSGHQFLARAGLAFHQHRRQITAGHASFGIEQLRQRVLEPEHRRRLADQRLATGFLCFALLVERQCTFHALGRQGFVEHQFEFGQHHRFGQVVKGALLHRQHGIFDVAVAGHHDHLELRRPLGQGLDQLMTVHARQRVVGQHRIGLTLGQLLQRLLGAMTNRDLEPFAL